MHFNLQRLTLGQWLPGRRQAFALGWRGDFRTPMMCYEIGPGGSREGRSEARRSPSPSRDLHAAPSSLSECPRFSLSGSWENANENAQPLLSKLNAQCGDSQANE